MKRVILTLLLAASVPGIALAQPAPSEPQSPTEHAAPPPSDNPLYSPAPAGATDEPTLMKQCVAQQQERAANSGMSSKEIKEYCKKQVKGATPR